MIIKLKGGLGNQMFQYAFGKMLQKEYGITNLKYDDSYIRNGQTEESGKIPVRLSYIDGLCINCKFASSKEVSKYLATKRTPFTLSYRMAVFIDKTINKDYYYERNRSYVNPDNIIRYKYLDGYWQSYRYLKSIRQNLLGEFKPRKELSKKTQDYISDISGKNAVMVGIRLGDYMLGKSQRNHYFQSDENYYNLAMKSLAGEIPNPLFIIFTNRVQECKERYKFDYPVIFRENHDYVNDFEELQIMRNCKHAIIAGSTFHWWGAWLIENDNKIVIRPSKWFIDDKPIDICPPEWESL